MYHALLRNEEVRFRDDDDDDDDDAAMVQQSSRAADQRQCEGVAHNDLHDAAEEEEEEEDEDEGEDEDDYDSDDDFMPGITSKDDFVATGKAYQPTDLVVNQKLNNR